MLSIKKYFIYFLNKVPSIKIFKLYSSKYNTSNIGIVITLHRVTDSKNSKDQSQFNSFIEISDYKLREVIRNLEKLDVKFVSLQELHRLLNSDVKLDKPVVHITFDDGYLDNYTLAYPLLKEHNIPFTIFVTSSFINNDHPFIWWYIIECIVKEEQVISFEKYNFSITEKDYHSKEATLIFDELRNFVFAHIADDKSYFEQNLLCTSNATPKMLQWQHLNEMVASGLCELGVHSSSHARFSQLTNDEKSREILDCKESIFKHTGVVSNYFAYPYGSEDDIGDWHDMEKVLDGSGIQLAFTTEPGELNVKSKKFFMSRIFMNDSANMYTLKSRINGSFQRGIVKQKHFKWDI